MTKMFGIPMQDIMVTLLVIMALCLAWVGFIAWRNPTMFRLGVRNIPRRKAQTVLIIFGLMLATLIISAALTIGDTLTYSIRKQVYDSAGPIDLTVVMGREDKGRVAVVDGPDGYFDRATYEAVRGKVAGNAAIDGLIPAIVDRAPVLNETAKLSEPVAFVLGVSPESAAVFGGVAARDGGALDLGALKEGEVAINAALAESLGAKVGDRLTVYAGNRPASFTVGQIARDGGLGGFNTVVEGAVLLPEARAQALFGQPGRYNHLLVSAKGDVERGLDSEPAAKDALKAAVAGTDLAVNPLKRAAMDQAETLGNVFTSFFLVFGLFAIAAGVMLIFLIFVMLAAERRSEMGMARAVGTKRRHLIQSFVAEGAAYDLMAAAVGALAGIGVAYGITATMARIFGNVDNANINITPHVEPRSLVIAYCLGVVVTFLTIAVSSWRVSRLNIVAAIRDLEDVKKAGGSWRGLVLGILGVALGALLWATAGTKMAPFSLGVSLIILASTLILRRLRLPNRLIYSLAGALLVVFWGLPARISERIFGKHEGDMEMFFISGIMMIAGAVLLLINNTELILAGINLFAGFGRRFVPAIKMGTAYPLASRFRTGLTLYMFALIIFVLVVMAAIQVNIDKVYYDPVKQTGGWDVSGQVLPTNPTDAQGIRATLAAGGVRVDDIEAIGGYAHLLPDQVLVQNAGSDKPQRYALNSVDDGFLAGTKFHLSHRATGYADDAAVWAAVRNDPNLVVADVFAVPNNGTGTDEQLIGDYKAAGISAGKSSFAPVQVELRSAVTGKARTVTIIGVTDTVVQPALGMFVNQRTVDELFGPQPVTNYLFKLRAGTDDRAMARAIESALLQNGMQATSIHEQIAKNTQTNAAFFNLLNGFIGLGLVVGIAALGVVAFRAVVERRQQIGMLRAIGFPRGMVSAAFLIESLFVTVLGIVAGITMGIVLGYNLFTGGGFSNGEPTSFIIPWGQVALFAVVALVAALLMTIIPSRQAGNVHPAEALRYE